MNYILQALLISFILLASLKTWDNKSNIIYRIQKVISYIIIGAATTSSIILSILLSTL